MASKGARASAFSLSLLLLATPALFAQAATGGGVSTAVMVSPPGLGINDTIDIDFEVRQWRELVDADSISLGVNGNWMTDVLVKTSTGRYHATYTLSAKDVYTVGVQFEVQADVGGWRGNTWAYYYARGVGGGSDFTGVSVRVIGGESPDSPRGAGSTVEWEASVWIDGALADPGRIEGTFDIELEGSDNTHPVVAWQHLSPGVYRTSATVPSPLSVPVRLWLTAIPFKDAVSLPWVGRLGYDSAMVAVYPLRASAQLIESTDSNYTVRVLAGDRSGPEADADVFVVPRGPNLPASCVNASAVTNASGQALVTVECAPGSVRYLEINVSKGERNIRIQLNILSYIWGNDCAGCYPDGLSVEHFTETIDMRPGQSVELEFSAHQGDLPLANAQLMPILIRTTGTSSVLADNVTTNALGKFLLPYTIPEDWAPGESLYPMFVGPAGDSASEWVTFGSGWSGSPAFSVLAQPGDSGAIHVEAEFSGHETLSDPTILVTVIPGSDLFGLNRAAGQPLQYSLARSGSQFEGDLTLPEWYPEADVVVVVSLSNFPAAGAVHQFTVSNLTTTHYTPVSSAVSPPVDPLPDPPAPEPEPTTPPVDPPPTTPPPDPTPTTPPADPTPTTPPPDPAPTTPPPPPGPITPPPSPGPIAPPPGSETNTPPPEPSSPTPPSATGPTSTPSARTTIPGSSAIVETPASSLFVLALIVGATAVLAAARQRRRT